jgi:Uma2 family endonuclease
MNSMAIESRMTTAEELLTLPRGRWRYELVSGVLRQMTPAGHVHGMVAARIGARLSAFVERHTLGEVYAAETGFFLRRAPDTVRAPDAAFVTTAHLQATSLSSDGYFSGPPDLAVEVVSPSDRPADVDAKIADWLDAGCQVVVRLDPRRAEATVHRANVEMEILSPPDDLVVPDLLPGWSVALSDLFG